MAGRRDRTDVPLPYRGPGAHRVASMKGPTNADVSLQIVRTQDFLRLPISRTFDILSFVSHGVKGGGWSGEVAPASQLSWWLAQASKRKLQGVGEVAPASSVLSPWTIPTQ